MLLNAYALKNADADNADSEGSVFECASIINDNFDEFKQAYNEALRIEYEESYEVEYEDSYIGEIEYEGEDSYACNEYMDEEESVPQAEYKPAYLEADYVESVADISITAMDEYGNELVDDGYLLNFNDEFGYLVIGSDYKLYAMETSGENPFNNISDAELVDREGEGFFYFKDGDMIDVNNLPNSVNKEDTYCSEAIYEGQTKKGCGRIYRPDLYTAKRYGFGYRKILSNRIPVQRYTQSQLSVYSSYDIQAGGGWMTEGNCWLVAGYHTLQYYSDTQILNAPKSGETIVYDPIADEPEIYENYYDENGNCKAIYNIEGTDFDGYRLNYSRMNHMPSLYSDVRKYASKHYGRCSGGYLSETCAIIEDISSSYGKKITCTIQNSWKKIPLLWNFRN